MKGFIERELCSEGKAWNQGKNTCIFTDALGPFPDEPLLSAVDKALHLSCVLYATLNGSAKTPSTVYNSGFLTDRSSSSDSSRKNSISSIQQHRINLSSLFISHSLPDLRHLPYDRITSPRFDFCPTIKNEDISPYQQNREVKSHQWVKTKTTPTGLRCYEIWSDDECKTCPSITFILSPSGETISFESASRE